MSKNIIKLLLIFALSIALIPASGQTVSKKKRLSKKEMEKELITQQVKIDSLVTIIEGLKNISYTDSINIYNSVALTFTDSSEIYIDYIAPQGDPDSLLNAWYDQTQLDINNMISSDYDSLEFVSNIPDSVIIEKLTKMNSLIPVPYNSIIRNEIVKYTQKREALAERLLGLSSYYLPMFEDILDQHGLPKELKALALIESALNPKAVSRAGAKGLWQFMYLTARQYNLHITSYVDERCDPVASTNAAARYLKDAYKVFGDWNLAIASYNCGAGNVNIAIRRAGGSKEFWDIYPFLPRETRGYVPAFYGALYLLNYYKDYNLIPTAPYKLPTHLDEFKVTENLHFSQIADNVGISIQELRQINPQYTQDIIPGSEKEYTLYLPHNVSGTFAEKESDIYAYKRETYFPKIVNQSIKNNTLLGSKNTVIHRVRSGETLGGIAQKYRVKLSELLRWNNLSSKSLIRVGQKINIYYGSSSSSHSASSTKQPTKPAAKYDADVPGTSKSGGYLWYTVKSGDTLLGIAIKYPQTDLEDILSINGFKKDTKIFPGKKIKIRRI